MKIKKLKTNHMTNPLGYRLDYLHFSWEVTQTDAKTDAFTRICIAMDDTFQTLIFDTGKMEHYGLPYFSPDITLQPALRYYWRVEIGTDKGEEAFETAWFETPLAKGEWKAKWICVQKEEEAMPEFYKTFTVKGAVKKARLYCYGLGLYEAYLGKEKIGDEFLTPGYHAYDLWNQYQTYDVTDMLTKGENRLSFIVGEGWYKGRFVFEGGYEKLYGERKVLTAMLELVYEDGSRQCICTDKSWRARECEIRSNNIYDGEVIDRTKVQKSLFVEETATTKPEPAASLRVPLRKTESFSVKEVIHTPSGETVLDFGEAITGWVEFYGDGYTDCLLQYGEHMQNGEIYRENLRTAKAEFSFKGEADKEWIRPHFTYYGFRYVCVKGYETIKKENFIAIRLMSDLEQTGRVETSNDKLNRLFENTRRSQKCNFIDIPLDCPQRDERMGWTGDIAIFARTGSFHMYTPAFLHHYMENLRLEQQLLKGAVPFFVPKPKVAPHEGINPFLVTAGVCTWGDAATIIPWELYLHYRDKNMLQIHYEAMCAWTEYVNTRVKENKKPYLWQNDRQLGDWLALDNGNIHNPIGSTDTGYIASAYYYYSTLLCSKAAGVLRKEADERKWREQAEEIKQAFIKEYFDKEGELLGNKTQTAYALALFMGLYETEKKAVLVAGLKNALKEYGNHVSTGFVGTGILMQALSENGLQREAYSLLLCEDYPSWLREVNLGATSIWERWNSLKDDGTINDTDMNSLNHYAYGCVAGWMYENLCGFRWTEDGQFYLKMQPDNRLSFVKGSYKTVYGECRVQWKYKPSGELIIEVQIPFQAKVSAELPWGEKKELTAGNYRWKRSHADERR